MTALSDILNRAKGDRSVDQMIDAARKNGAEVDSNARGNIYKALKGDHAQSPTDRTLRMWAAVFGVTPIELREAAGRPPGELGPWVPTDEAGQLSQPIREALDGLIKAIVREGATGLQVPTVTAGHPDYRFTAADGTAEVLELKGQPRNKSVQSLGRGLAPGATKLVVVVHYLGLSQQDPAVAATLLAQDGARGANVDKPTWLAALEELANAVPEDRVAELPEAAAARRNPGRGPAGPTLQPAD
ncbi:MAG TPA: hypothetical protein VLI04_01980 [Nocardioidaceae bacterium]|nr:hypothetical protein [Nocardioidaceae bacterium]